MAAIVLECSQHGDFDSFDVIRSSTSMVGITDEDLPTPIVTGLKIMFYIDTSITEGEIYYYKWRVWRDGMSQVSEQQVVIRAINSAYRYLRLWILADNGHDNYTEFQEIEIASSIDGPDITTPLSPTWQSSYLIAGVHRNAQKLVDNNFTGINNIWTSDGIEGFPRWVSFDLGNITVLQEIRLWPTYDTSYGDFTGRAPKDFIIQGSNDSITWFDMKKVNNLTGWVQGIPKVIRLTE